MLVMSVVVVGAFWGGWWGRGEWDETVAKSGDFFEENMGK
jgi:hypothetical protein